MKALTAPVAGGGGNLLCSHRSGDHQFISINHFSPLNLPRTSAKLPNHDHFLQKPKTYFRFKLLIARAADSTQAPIPAAATGGKSVVEDQEFSLAKVSFGVIGLGLGVSLLSYGFGAYFNILPGSEWSALMLTYGFPLSIIGMALKYAELKPVPCLTYSDAQMLREKCATPILKQVRDDVIRFRYGDEQHLEEALKRIFQYGLGGGVARRNAPVLQKIREEVTEDGKYCLVLVFEAKALELADFEKRQEKFASFFGPGISAEVGKGVEENTYDVRLISNTTL
ncbi:hypothetical protein OSB04_007160 [Centaurea solstitialis]|uniref:Acclimation of photosynthesis to environment n=1 Tax=Centaurea solstitialis TaxID=347529 RepID=A0AA38TW16_9ASTR|nr:hypothetical protein OSB04_007160 [Centaurea solstitialis]